MKGRASGLFSVLFMACAGLLGCDGAPTYLSRDELLDPQTCAKCHPDHYKEWSGSMHAYSAEDPIFLAMNRRGQRETQGALGSFCVNCHAPLALREGATTDGLNLAAVPARLRGVTCFFCHTVEAVDGTHNAPLRLARDIVMRGEFGDPVENSGHPGAYSPLHDRDRAESAKLCGSCHDIVTPLGGAIERTYAEWQLSVFAHAGGATCSQCHMDQSTNLRPIAMAPSVFARRFHSHAAAAVDTALVAGFPEAAAQKQKVQEFLDTTLQSALCVRPSGGTSVIRVILDNVAAGHGFPSGSAQDRRLWAEVVAYQDGKALYQSGVVPEGMAPTKLNDPDLWLLRDCMLDAGGKEVPMFWQAAGYETNQLPTQVTLDMLDPRFYKTHVVQSFPRSTRDSIAGVPDRVTLRLRLQPVGLDVLDDLVGSGDLDPALRGRMPTFDIGAAGGGQVLEWTAATARDVYMDDLGLPVYCISKTNLSAQGDKTPALNHMKCSP